MRSRDVTFDETTLYSPNNIHDDRRALAEPNIVQVLDSITASPLPLSSEPGEDTDDDEDTHRSLYVHGPHNNRQTTETTNRQAQKTIESSVIGVTEMLENITIYVQVTKCGVQRDRKDQRYGSIKGQHLLRLDLKKKAKKKGIQNINIISKTKFLIDVTLFLSFGSKLGIIINIFVHISVSPLPPKTRNITNTCTTHRQI